MSLAKWIYVASVKTEMQALVNFSWIYGFIYRVGSDLKVNSLLKVYLNM